MENLDIIGGRVVSLRVRGTLFLLFLKQDLQIIGTDLSIVGSPLMIPFFDIEIIVSKLQCPSRRCASCSFWDVDIVFLDIFVSIDICADSFFILNISISKKSRPLLWAQFTLLIFPSSSSNMQLSIIVSCTVRNPQYLFKALKENVFLGALGFTYTGAIG